MLLFLKKKKQKDFCFFAALQTRFQPGPEHAAAPHCL
jgi:hypothetical protein